MREIPDERIYDLSDYADSLLNNEGIWQSYYHQIVEVVGCQVSGFGCRVVGAISVSPESVGAISVSPESVGAISVSPVQDAKCVAPSKSSSPLPPKILEIGIGLGITKLIVSKLIPCEYHTIDFNEKLNPDYVGSVLSLPFADNTYDTVCCFEVLEHLPYSDFEPALKEIFRVAKSSVIISLPNCTPTFKLNISNRGNLFNIPLPFLKRKICKDHHWEINRLGCPEKKVINTIKRVGETLDFKIEKAYRPKNNPYHHYFKFIKKI